MRSLTSHAEPPALSPVDLAGKAALTQSQRPSPSVMPVNSSSPPQRSHLGPLSWFGGSCVALSELLGVGLGNPGRRCALPRADMCGPRWGKRRTEMRRDAGMRRDGAARNDRRRIEMRGAKRKVVRSGNVAQVVLCEFQPPAESCRWPTSTSSLATTTPASEHLPAGFCSSGS